MSTARRVSQTEFLALFESFPKTQQTKIIKLLNDKLFTQQFEALDRELPDMDVSDEEIMNEVRAVRYGKPAHRL